MVKECVVLVQQQESLSRTAIAWDFKSGRPGHADPRDGTSWPSSCPVQYPGVPVGAVNYATENANTYAFHGPLTRRPWQLWAAAVRTARGTPGPGAHRGRRTCTGGPPWFDHPSI